jgi:hypothetical protein
MSYPWPPDEEDPVLEEALDIAMDYLEITGQAFPFSQIQRICAGTILSSWRDGTKHRIRLANDAIVAIENNAAPDKGNLRSFYPKVS